MIEQEEVKKELEVDQEVVDDVDNSALDPAIVEEDSPKADDTKDE